MKIQELFDKYKIRTEENFPQQILDIELEEDIKYFNKGYKHNNTIIFKGEYQQKDTDYNRKFNIKIIVKSLNEIDFELLSKIEEYTKNNKKSIWENKEEVMNALKLLDIECVEYYLSSQDIPTTFITYNAMGGIIKHS